MDIAKKIELISASKISTYELNNRIHTPEQIDHISQSIKEFGFNQPLVVDENLVILVGHGRFEAAQKLGMKEIPCFVLKHLDENKKKAYRIIDNKLQNDSTWNIDNLTFELESLDSSGFDIEFCGVEDLLKAFEVDKSGIKNKINKEWEENGTAEFNSADNRPDKTIYVHFKDYADFEKFKNLMSQFKITLTEETKSIWFPDNTREKMAHLSAV